MHREFVGNDIHSEYSKEFGVYENEFYIELPKEYLLEKIETHKESTTFGYDHWIDVGTIFARPTYGVQINVVLKGDLVIKDEFVTGNSKQYQINKSDNYIFNSSGWISSYCGICLLVATKQEK